MTTARDLTRDLMELLHSERSALARFLLALAAFHRDERWRELGHISLFYFLRRELGLSAGAAQHRKTAAELILDFPEIIEPIREGRLCLSTVCEVQKVLTRENWKDLLPRFYGLSRREAEALVAELQPATVVPLRALVTAVRAPASPGRTTQPNPEESIFTNSAFHLDETVIDVKESPASEHPSPVPLRGTVVPLTADLRRVNYTVSKRFLEKLVMWPMMSRSAGGGGAWNQRALQGEGAPTSSSAPPRPRPCAPAACPRPPPGSPPGRGASRSTRTSSRNRGWRGTRPGRRACGARGT